MKVFIVNNRFFLPPILLQDIDYVIWTGDLVPHDVWMQTNEDLMNIIEESIKLVSEKLSGIPIFPALGNHERAPANWFENRKNSIKTSTIKLKPIHFSAFRQSSKIIQYLCFTMT